MDLPSWVITDGYQTELGFHKSCHKALDSATLSPQSWVPGPAYRRTFRNSYRPKGKPLKSIPQPLAKDNVPTLPSSLESLSPRQKRNDPRLPPGLRLCELRIRIRRNLCLGSSGSTGHQQPSYFSAVKSPVHIKPQNDVKHNQTPETTKVSSDCAQ